MELEINLKVKIKGKEINLTVNEAQELFDNLNLLFGPKWNYVYPTWSTGTWTYPGTQITCTDGESHPDYGIPYVGNAVGGITTCR
jgi:hypothetical protein